VIGRATPREPRELDLAAGSIGPQAEACAWRSFVDPD